LAGTSVVLDTSVLAALLDPREQHHRWAVSQTSELPPPWAICEAILTETLFLLEDRYKATLIELARGGYLEISFSLANELKPVLARVYRRHSRLVIPCRTP
jgi:predicted nucleic acid-binding protein